jgi:hypothetical protein
MKIAHFRRETLHEMLYLPLWGALESTLVSQ